MGNIEVSKIEPNKWNPNVMQETEYAALKQDMRVHGVNGVDAILVSPKVVFYCQEEAFQEKGFVIVDGEHRWQVAKELGWKEIRCDIESIKEDEAKALCYRRNRERGTIDPFKEAFLFKTDLEKLSQGKIAGKYGVDQSTVSHRLSLLKIDSDVLRNLEKLPRGTLSTSHFEPLATLELKDQEELAKRILTHAKQWNQPMTVKDVARDAENFREKREEARQLTEALKTAKFPKCPKCGKEPDRISYKKLPWVDCSSGHYDHEWSLGSGKLLYEPIRESQQTMDGESRPLEPKTLRSVHKVQEISKVFIELIRKTISEDEGLEISEIDVSGKLHGSDFSFDINTYGKSMSVSWHHGGTWQGFRAEEHDYKTGEKSAITTGSPDKIESVKQLIENAFKGTLGLKKVEVEIKVQGKRKKIDRS